MLWLGLAAVAALFALLGIARVAGARRADLQRHLTTLLFAGAAVLALTRGRIGWALALAAVSTLAWAWTERKARRAAPIPAGMTETRARAILGIGQDAGVDAIRAAYRAKIAQAHPDRGGTAEAAAELNAAKDFLLKK